MRTNIGALSFEVPSDFLWGETTVSYLAAPPKAVRDPRLLQEQAVAARPNLVVNQRTTTEFGTLEAVVEDLTKRLTATVKAMQDLKVANIVFADGVEGVVLAYQFPFGDKSVLRQMHAVRLDHDTITTFVLTTAAALGEDQERRYLEALASASIAQVHRAKLRHEDGPIDVVLKIQRPGIKNTIERDIELLYLFARAIERSIPEAQIYSPVGLVAEFDRAITAELDFTREADNAERLARSFAEDPTARFPKIYRDVSGKRLLTMEFLRGKHITDALAEGYSGERLAKNTLQIVFKQIFEDGFFHGDPHPGNLMVMGAHEEPVLAICLLYTSPSPRD